MLVNRLSDNSPYQFVDAADDKQILYAVGR